jgi:CheY-like chemotaxis protein
MTANDSPLSRLRLIVVDDNAEVGGSLGALLRLAGHTVVVFESGQDALDALDSFVPDAMILDLVMPQMNGFELARRVRSRAGWNRLPLIAVTGNAQDDDRQATRAAGIDFHFAKPTHAEALLRTLVGLK